MSRFCTNCGATLADDAVFCTECGASVSAGVPLTPAEPETAPGPEVSPVIPAAQYTPDQPEPIFTPQPEQIRPAEKAEAGKKAEPAAPEKRSKEISTAGYFWLMFLFYIPVIGLLAELVFAFLIKNKNLRNYARANLIWVIVGLVVALILYVTARILFAKSGTDINWDAIVEQFRPVLPQSFIDTVIPSVIF